MIYLDSSVIFSVQGKDINTSAAVQLLKSAGETLVLTELCEVEFINALCRREFLKQIAHAQAEASISDLALNVRREIFQLLPFPAAAFGRAKTLVRQLTPSIGVRAADVLHAAAAIELGASALYTFDQRQHRAAQAAGLKVNSP